MWCSHCGQDVPAIATPEDGKARCTRCREPIGGSGIFRSEPLPATAREKSENREKPTETSEVPAWAFVERPPIDLDAWRWDQDLHEADRLVRSHRAHLEPTPRADAARPADPAAKKLRLDTPPRPATPRAVHSATPRFALFAWAFLSIGVMALVFGGVLLGWSCWSGQQQFWTLGLPFAIGGQAALVLGLVLQLDGLWQSNREASTVLSELDEQLGELRQATSLLSTTHSSPAQSFYFHLAEGASPHMLLTDLKGQLDLLAMRMAKDESP